jgi:hypothetical protein
LVVDQNVWALYWSLIQKHVLDKWLITLLSLLQSS